MQNQEQLNALIQTLDDDPDKLIVYNLLDTIYATFKGWKEWKLRNVRGEWTVVQERSLYNAICPQPEYIPPSPPANVCTLCCGTGLDDLSGFGGGQQFRYSSVEVCLACAGTGRPAVRVASDSDIEYMQQLHEAVA